MNKLPENFQCYRYGLFVRFVSVDDADFIVRLRTDSKLGMYIHKTDSDVNKQIEWINLYKNREKEGAEYYFMFENPQGNKLGVERIYNISENDFTLGSWLFDPKSPIGASIIADIITREIASELFPEKNCCWDVKKQNINVIRYVLSYHPEIYRETEDTIYYRCSKENNEKYKHLFLRRLIR